MTDATPPKAKAKPKPRTAARTARQLLGAYRADTDRFNALAAFASHYGAFMPDGPAGGDSGESWKGGAELIDRAQVLGREAVAARDHALTSIYEALARIADRS